MEPSNDPDLKLVLACQGPQSDQFETAFEALYLKYRDRVYSIAYRMTGKTSDAMDVAQEAFSLVFRKIAAFRSDSRFSTWLFRIVVNCSIDYLRQSRSVSRRGNACSLQSIVAAAEPVDIDSQDPLESAVQSELGVHVQQSIQRLSPKLRAILVLRYMEGQSYEELAGTLGISIGTVKSRLARAHIALEALLKGTLSQFGYPEEPGSPEEKGLPELPEEKSLDSISQDSEGPRQNKETNGHDPIADQNAEDVA